MYVSNGRMSVRERFLPPYCSCSVAYSSGFTSKRLAKGLPTVLRALLLLCCFGCIIPQQSFILALLLRVLILNLGAGILHPPNLPSMWKNAKRRRAWTRFHRLQKTTDFHLWHNTGNPS